jgi:hypothetical protein
VEGFVLGAWFLSLLVSMLLRAGLVSILTGSGLAYFCAQQPEAAPLAPLRWTYGSQGDWCEPILIFRAFLGLLEHLLQWWVSLCVVIDVCLAMQLCLQLGGRRCPLEPSDGGLMRGFVSQSDDDGQMGLSRTLSDRCSVTGLMVSLCLSFFLKLGVGHGAALAMRARQAEGSGLWGAFWGVPNWIRRALFGLGWGTWNVGWHSDSQVSQAGFCRSYGFLCGG